MNQLAESFDGHQLEMTRHHLLLPDVRCAGCCLTIEREMNAISGVDDVRVSYATRRLSFTAGREIAQTAINKIRDLGYEVRADDTGEALDSYRAERRAMLSRLGVAGIGMMQVMMYALATYLAPGDGMESDMESLFRWASLVIALPVTFFSAMPFHKGAWRDLRNATVGMDVPVSLAILSAFSLSTAHTLTGTGEIYFDSACMFTFFLLTGRYLEMTARQRFQVEKSLGEHLLPAEATLVDGETIAVKSLTGGERLLIRAGDIIPADCRIIEGRTSADESAFTGESRPVNKQTGSRLLAGSRNLDGEVLVEVGAAYDEWLINALGQLYREAAGFRPRFAVLADRIARYFVAVILVLAAATGLYWMLQGRTDAFAVALSVLVVSCPCALSLATPVAYSIATGALSRLGVLVSNGAFLEKLQDIDTVVLDKTGTLTYGSLQLEDIVPLADLSAQEVINLAASVEEASLHPIAITLRDKAERLHAVVDARVEPGEGVTGMIDGRCYRLGRSEFSVAQAVDRPHGDGSWVLLAADGEPLAWLSFRDQVRSEAAVVVQQLQARGNALAVFSGDSSQHGTKVLANLGLVDVSMNMTPQDKIEALQRLQAGGHKVLMVGDGLNDTGAMASADVAIAISPVDTVVQSAADATLVSNDLGALVTVLDYGSRVTRVIRQNITWALAYNLTVIPVAVMGLLPPWLAALGMSLSSLLVTVNACRLVRQ